jgi:hypothetical protein
MAGSSKLSDLEAEVATLRKRLEEREVREIREAVPAPSRPRAEDGMMALLLHERERSERMEKAYRDQIASMVSELRERRQPSEVEMLALLLEHGAPTDSRLAAAIEAAMPTVKKVADGLGIALGAWVQSRLGTQDHGQPRAAVRPAPIRPAPREGGGSEPPK